VKDNPIVFGLVVELTALRHNLADDIARLRVDPFGLDRLRLHEIRAFAAAVHLIPVALSRAQGGSDGPGPVDPRSDPRR